MIEGAIIALVGVIVGRFLPGRPQRKIKNPKAVCGCLHSIGYHENKTGTCGYVGSRFVGYNGNSEKYEAQPCGCKHYDGPIPVESFFAPPLLPPGDNK